MVPTVHLLYLSPLLLPPPSSSTNLTELAKAVCLLAALSPSTPSGDELLKAARALAAATAALLNSAQPENIEVSINFVIRGCLGGRKERGGRGKGEIFRRIVFTRVIILNRCIIYIVVMRTL